MKLGTTFDENILKSYEFNNTINELIINGATFIEIAPDQRLIPNELLKLLIDMREKEHIRLHTHIPYFIDTDYDADFFKGETLLFKTFFDTLKGLNTDDNMNITFHGAKYTDNKGQAKDQTYRFIDYALNKVEKLKLNSTINLETLNHNHSPIFGESVEDFNTVINDFKTDKLKITWDLAHSKLGGYDIQRLAENLKSHINYVHIHGLDGNLCHLALHDKEEQFTEELNLLMKHCPNIDINVEQTVSAMGKAYLDETIKDLKHLSEIIKYKKA